MTEKVFNREEEIEVCNKLECLIKLLGSKNAPVEDLIEMRNALTQVSLNKKELKIPVEALKTFNRLWKKYKN